MPRLHPRHLIRRISESIATAFYGIVVAGLAMGVVITWIVSASLAPSDPSRR